MASLPTGPGPASPRPRPSSSLLGASPAGPPAHGDAAPRRRAGSVLAAVMAGLLAVGVTPAPASAATTTDVATWIHGSITADRVEHGLVGYRTWPVLAALATERAQRMADAHELSHAVAGGSVGDALDARGIGWLGYGEVIGMTGWEPGPEAADSLFGMWRDSDVHRAILRSGSYNYVGVGVARAGDGSTWASVVMTESLDHTSPTAQVVSLRRSGTTLGLAWSGSDPRLQTHTAGLHSLDVAMRRDGGRWRLIRDDTIATALVLRDRARGHWYAFRVKARDRRGNLSWWTTVTRIWVP